MIILSVDDDDDDRELFSEAVRHVNPAIKCLTATNGVEAHILLSDGVTHRDLDYIFLDINMPKMNGLDLLALIKKDESLAQIPVCMLSTACNAKEIALIRSTGASYFQKQSEFQKTVDMLSSILTPRVEAPVRNRMESSRFSGAAGIASVNGFQVESAEVTAA